VLHVAVVESLLDAVGSLFETRGQVAGIEQADPQTDIASRRDERLAHRVGVLVRRAIRLVVQVVELTDGIDAGEPHLGIRREGQEVQQFRVEHSGECVHVVAP
jgi:hypothetical protein